MRAFLNSLWRAYLCNEPPAFRQAEQFGLEERPCVGRMSAAQCATFVPIGGA